MAFREKVAWAAFGSTVLIWGTFFTFLLSLPHEARGLAMLGPFILGVLAQAIIMAGAAIFWAIRSPGEANAPADERERALGYRATSAAYFVLIMAVFAVIGWLHFGLHGPDTIFALAAAFIIAESVRFATTAVGYRIRA